MTWTGTPLPLLNMAEVALDCVQSVATWEGRSSNQRPAYAKFEASKCQQPHNHAIFFTHLPDSVDTNCAVCKVFQIRWQH
jgi:hypothetical protein